MKLPQVNPNEELEDISNNKFIPLFDVKKFEIRKEPGRDKGIDFRIEIKRNGVYTGFRLLIQLKATEAVKRNTDGSISIPIDTSNINYLLNAGIPAYYCLYFKKDDIFLFENVNDFVKRLSESKSYWQNQDSHALRLHARFTEKSLSVIYDNAYERGLFLRKLNQKLAENSSLVSEKVVVDSNLNIVSDSEIRRFIEGLGLHLINESRSIDVIRMHDKGSQQVASTAKYNMVVGIAYYYTGELVKSLNFVKTATRLKDELTPDLLEHLLLFDISVRYALGIITKEEYDSRLSQLGKSSHIKYYLRIQKEKELYLSSADPDVDKRYDDFLNAMTDILNAPDANENIKLLVKCELILYEGSKINMDFARGISGVKAYETVIGFSKQLRSDMLGEILQRKFSWAAKANDLRRSSINSGNLFTFYHVLLNESRVNYEFEVYADLVNFENETNLSTLADARLEQIDNILVSLGYAASYFEGRSHVDNLCAVLALQYEVAHYKKDFAEARKIIDRVSELIDTYEYKDFKSKLASLKSGGTTHEKLAKFYSDISNLSRQKQEEYDEMVSEMKKLDELDKNRENSTSELDTIELFPIGHFRSPKKLRHDMFRILNVSEDAQKSFVTMWDEEKVIPIANIYCNPIKEEGYADVVQSNNIEVWRNISRIRRELFERGFHRVNIGF